MAGDEPLPYDPPPDGDSIDPNDAKPFDGQFDKPVGDYPTDPLVGDPPPVPGGADHPGKGVTAVSTEALKTFAANIGQLEGPLRTARDEVVKVNVKPGAFFDGHALAGKVNGGGLVDPTAEFLRTTLEAAIDIVAKAGKIATDYASAEAFNKMTAAQLGTYTAEISDDINAGSSH